jgi:ADP-ribosylglycohydrolase
MRVSPIGLWHKDMETTRAEAKASAAATHDHPEGIKGAEATAAAVFLARIGADKETIKAYITSEFGYSLTESVDSIRTWYEYDISCQGTVPPAVICFLESTDFEDSIRNAISIGGDSDTIACITGGIAEAFYGIPADIKDQTMSRLPADMRTIVEAFYNKIMSRIKFEQKLNG